MSKPFHRWCYPKVDTDLLSGYLFVMLAANDEHCRDQLINSLRV